MSMLLTAEHIASIRKALGLSQRELAELLDVTEAAVSRWEANKRRPRYEMMERLNALAEQNKVELLAAS